MTDAIAGAAMRCRTMADGSLRIEVEIEPKDAQAAFALFGRPGAPMALAALREGYAQAKAQEPADIKGGPLARLAGQWCKLPEFQDWCQRVYVTWWSGIGSPEHCAREVICNVCKVQRRRELDHDEGAAATFHRAFRIPFNAVLAKQEQPA